MPFLNSASVSKLAYDNPYLCKVNNLNLLKTVNDFNEEYTLESMQGVFGPGDFINVLKINLALDERNR